MTNEYRVAFVVEGERFEPKLFKKLTKAFFNKGVGKISPEIIILPSCVNIYMLWQELQNDDYLDIIEVIREKSPNSGLLNNMSRKDFAEVFLFFDLDPQHNKDMNITKSILLEMLKTFDNETENGKLYISYPMIESIRDFRKGGCLPFSGKCYINTNTNNYKQLSGDNNKMAQINKYTLAIWVDVLKCFLSRISCLVNAKKLLELNDIKHLSPIEVFKLQMELDVSSGSIMILSAVPEFLIDYMKSDELFSFIKNNSRKQ